MASDLTPERRDFLRGTANLESGIVLVAKEELLALLDMAERCADYDRRLGAVMPADFSDWHKNGPKEWPEVAAEVVTNLREREASAIDECEALKIQLQVADRDAAAARHMLGQEIEIRRENERASDEALRLMRARPAIEFHSFTGTDSSYDKLVAKERAAGELLRAAKEAANWLLECDQDDDAQKLYAAIEAAERAGVGTNTKA